ncbi:MAG: DUF4091 domain-containing protein [Alloprevotella sp.]|nr:DUF4091 domain-containing protein [Alloprevotella sp.]
MKKTSLLLAALLAVLSPALHAQERAKYEYAATDYVEMDDGVRPDAEKWDALERRPYLSWGSRDVHCVKTAVPQLKLRTDTVVYAWRGERVGVEAVLFSPVDTHPFTLSLRADEGADPLAGAATARFLRYVMTDGFKSCGTHPTDLKPYLVPDVVDVENSLALSACTTRPLWLTLEVPRDIAAGEYGLTLSAATDEGSMELYLRVVVCDRTLPLPSEQAFHLDFWQQPYSVSRYYGVERWSDAHFELLRPYMELLARAGQSVVTTILFYEPWGDQSNDKFSAMISTTKKKDGTWAYDFTVFDRWVEFMASCGISKQIDCYSMIPWDMTFRYYDEASGRDVDFKTTTSAADYKALWVSFLQSFAAHLREKGWFEKTLIAMDERGLQNMLDAYAIAQEAVPGMKMALAGNYHSELVDKLADYCVAFGQSFTASELKARREKGWYSTVYTCCTERQPNIFTNSLPAEAPYLPLFALANDFDGYLHWSWLNWTDDPLKDSRFRLFSPGDTYVVYPGPRSSVRWERFIEGVQQTEKVRILREAYRQSGDAEALQHLEDALEPFRSGIINYTTPAARSVNLLESVLNGAPEPPADDIFDYCEVLLAEDKHDVATQKRWLTQATTTGCLTDLDYSASAPSATGYVLTAPIVVERGKSFKLRTVAAQNDDDLRYCRAGLFADWNCDSIFDASKGEKIGALGTANAGNTSLLDHTFTVRVPQTAACGLTRLRLCYADAWKELPQPCGELYKGFALDVPMQIVADDGVRQPRADMAESLTLTRRGDTIHLSAPASLCVYTADGAVLDRTPPLTLYSLRDYLPGTYLLSAVADGARRTACKILR